MQDWILSAAPSGGNHVGLTALIAASKLADVGTAPPFNFFNFFITVMARPAPNPSNLT
jgi:hypothetical protein